MFEEYSIGQLANQKLREVLEKGVSPELLKKLQNKEYSKKSLGVNFSVLLVDEGNGKPTRYYKQPLSINNKSFFLTSEWYP